MNKIRILYIFGFLSLVNSSFIHANPEISLNPSKIFKIVCTAAITCAVITNSPFNDPTQLQKIFA